MRAGNTAIPSAAGTYSYAAHNAKSGATGNVFHIRIGERRKLNCRAQPGTLGVGGAHSRRALVSCECPSRLLLPVQLLRGTLQSDPWVGVRALMRRGRSQPLQIGNKLHLHCIMTNQQSAFLVSHYSLFKIPNPPFNQRINYLPQSQPNLDIYLS